MSFIFSILQFNLAENSMNLTSNPGPQSRITFAYEIYGLICSIIKVITSQSAFQS